MSGDDTLVLVEHDRAAARTWSPPGFEVAHASVPAFHKRVSEDAACCVGLGEEALMACVIDGMGGTLNGGAAARLAAETLAELFGTRPGPGHRRATLVESFERAHGRIVGLGTGAGATAVGAILTPEDAQVVHCGDAEALLFGQRGRRKYRTVAHSPVGYALHAGLLTEEEAMAHPERHLVSSAIGLDGMTIQVGPRVPMAARDTLVLASDGLTDNVYADEIVEHLRAGPLAAGLDRLMALARGRMERAAEDPDAPPPAKNDDLTVLAVRRTSR